MVPGGRRRVGPLHDETAQGEAEKSWLRHAAKHIEKKSSDKGKLGGVERGSRTDTAVAELKNEGIDRVAKYRFS